MHLHKIKILFTKPWIILEIINIILISLYRALSVRGLRGYMITYPKEIVKIAKKIPNIKNNIIFSHDKSLDQKVFNFKLATGYFNFSTNNSWKEDLNSHEQYVSLHRLNWLLRDSYNGEMLNHDDGMNLIRSWFSSMNIIPKGEAGESYSTAERLSNICLFSREITGNWNDVPSDIQVALNVKIKFLAHRLEILPGLSGNHVINNSRALLLSGHVCKNLNAIILSRSILKNYLPKVLGTHGFLREGSSHYQLLICRWLLEMRFIAEELNDLETIEILKEYIPNVLKASKFFLIEKDRERKIPLFGDISPDCDPLWLQYILESPLSLFNNKLAISSLKNEDRGWAGLFSNFAKNDNIQWNFSEYIDKDWIQNEISGWYRLDFHGWTAIWHAESPSGSAIASHAHHDLCSFVLYKNGIEVIIDPGRLNYENNDIGNYGLSAQSHSTILLNGFPTALSKRDHRIPKTYREANVNVSCRKNENSYRVTIEHDGFGRISSGIQNHLREFIFTEDSVTIFDNIDGKGKVDLEIYFQVSKKSSYQISLDKKFKNNNEKFEGSMNPIGGWEFTSFGVKDLAITKRINKNISLPFNCTTKIELIN